VTTIKAPPTGHLYDVQGSYWHHVKDHGKGGWRANLRLFVLTDSATAAIKLWTAEACSREGVDVESVQAEVAQVIRRMAHRDVIVDPRFR
jgi:hypothetical protein